MHHFIFPTADTWISSGSNKLTGKTFEDQNFGQDEILELKKEFYNFAFDYPTRVLVNFSGEALTQYSQSINPNKNNLKREDDLSKIKYSLRLYETKGNKDLSTEYTIAALPISESWDEGSGKFGNDPKTTDGCSWNNRKNKPNAENPLTWSVATSNNPHKVYGGNPITGSTTAGLNWACSQSFAYQSPDINMDVTRIVDSWFDKKINDDVGNNGFLLKYSGSQELDSQTFGNLKFFSRNTHTIFAPRLEVKWDDHAIVTGSATGSLIPLTMDGGEDHYVYPIGIQKTYKENERVKFRLGVRKRYIQKTFSTSVQTVTGSYIPEGSGSYSIIDVATGETIVPFGSYTSMSCDSTSPYFNQWLDGFFTDRTYKILLKLKYNDNQERIFDEDIEFKVTQ